MTTGEILSNAIAFISLFLSYLGYRATRKSITIDFTPFFYSLNPKTDITFPDGTIKDIDATRAFYTTIDIVNSSTVDMAYMDLRAFDPVTNNNHFVATYRVLPILENQKIIISPFGPTALENFHITLPPRKFAPLPAGSCTSIDVLVFLNDNVDTSHGVMLSIKTTETTFFHKSPWSDTNRKKFKEYHFLYNLNTTCISSTEAPPTPPSQD